MKRIILITLWAYIAGLCSCTYDYEMPDTSNLSRTYSVENASSILDEWEQIVNEEYHLNLSNPEETKWEYVESKWECIIIEKDVNGNTLYEGEPRFAADYDAYAIDVAYVCYVRLNRRNEYSEYARFRTAKSFILNSTPIPTLIIIDAESFKNCIVEFPSESERVYAYDIQCDKSISDLLKSKGLSFSESGITVTERNEDGDILYQGGIEKYYGLEDYHISAKGTVTVEVTIQLNRGILQFNEKFRLKDFGNQTLVLTTSNDYTLIETDPEYYIYDIDYSSDVYDLMSKTVESIGFDLYDFTINVIEKDKDGNIIYQGEKPGRHGELGYAHKGAKTIQIYIDLYGYHRENYPFEDEIKIGTITFDDTFKLSDIYKQTLMLTTSYVYTIELIAEPEQKCAYSISIDSSTTNAINEQLLNPANCRFGHYEIIVTEKDMDGNILYQGEYEIHTTRQSQEGAKTLEATIHVYGYDRETYPYGEEKKIGSLIFTEPFNLAEAENLIVLSIDEYAHSFVRE